MGKELICEDYYFYSNNYSTKTTFRGVLFCNDNDLQDASTCIRLYGTKEQVSKALDEYVDKTGLALDECYTYEIEKEGTFFYDAKRNIEIAKSLSMYNEIYLERNKVALVINLI
jgi:hypothetical protein